MNNFIKGLVVVGAIVSAFFSSITWNYLLPVFLGKFKVVVAGLSGLVIACAYCANEFSRKPSWINRIILSSTTIVGAAMFCYANLEYLHKQSEIRDLDISNYEQITATTYNNANKSVLKSQRESIRMYRDQALSHSANPADFFKWLSKKSGYGIGAIMVAVSCLFALASDVSLISLIRTLNPTAKSIKDSFLQGANFVKNVFAPAKKNAKNQQKKVQNSAHKSAQENRDALTKSELFCQNSDKESFNNLTKLDKQKLIVKTYRECKKNQSEAARRLGIKRQTVSYQLKLAGILKK